MTDTAITSTTVDVSLLSPPEDGAFFLGRATLQRFSGQGLPANARSDAPPNEQLSPYTRWRWDGEAWTQAEDHRGRAGYLPDGTERVINQWGSLPDGWSEEKPEKPLVGAQEEKRREIHAAYDVALAAAITMPISSPSPITVAVETAALLAIDPDAVDSIKAALNARRTELLALVDAAQNATAATAIVVNYPV